MRETLTFLAAGVLVVLALALAVPPFIDWTAYGAALGARFGQALGADVRLAGPISVRLLPSPHFRTGALRVTRPGLDVQADAASLEMSLAPLLRGTLTIASARLDRPRVAIDTTVSAVAPSFGDLGIDHLDLRDASFSLKTEAASRQLDRVDAVVSAESASGPFRAQGFVRVGNRLLPFRVATGAINAGLLPVKIDVDPLAGLPKGEAAGTLALDRHPRFAGTATLSGEIEGAARGGLALPWRAKLDGMVSARTIQADKVEIRAGDERSQWTANGTGRLDERGLSLSLTSERPDFDRILAASELWRIADALAAGTSDRAFAIDWRADASVLGGDVVNDARVALARRPGDAPGLVRADISFAAARGGVVSFKGDLHGLARAAGNFALRTDDAPAFGRWLAALSPKLEIPAMPVSRADIAGRVEIGKTYLVVSGLRAALDRSSFTGRVDYAKEEGKGAAKLAADLEADALDLDALPDLASLGRRIGGVDLAVALEARAIRVARVGRASVEAGHISLELTRAGDVLSLDRLSLDNLGGATLRARGRTNATDAHFEAMLDARQLGDLAALIRRVAPGAFSDALASRASLLAPATLDLAFDAKAAGNGPFVPVQLTATGKLADTGLRASFAPRAEVFEGALALSAPEAAPLLRQLGVPVLPLRGQGGAAIDAKLSGRAGAPLAVTATGTIAGASAQFNGPAMLDGDTPEVAGALKVTAGDLGPLLRIVAAPVDSFTGWPADLSAHLALRGRRIAAKNISGRIGGASVTGSLARDGSAPVTGALHLDRLDAASLAASLLGLPQGRPSGQTWSALAFGQQPNDPPDADVDLSADRLSLGGVAATKATARLKIRAGAIEASDARMSLAGGTVAGSAALRRQDKTASFATSLVADGVALKRPWVSARLSGRVELAGAGANPAALVGSLGGQGVLRVAGGEIARADPDAPLHVAKAVDAEEIPLDPRIIDVALARAFDAGAQRLPDFEQPVSIAGGQGVLAPLDLAIGATRVTLGARYDLARDRMDLRESLHPAAPEDWAGPPPTVDLAFSGPSDAPARAIDAADLIGTLAAHGIAREQARIAAIEADQRERAFFNRRLKFDRALEAQRKAEEARIEAARQEVLKHEAARQESLRQETLRQETLRQEALRQERERQEPRHTRESEKPARGAPLDVRPPAATRPAAAPAVIAPDPGTAGRY